MGVKSSIFNAFSDYNTNLVSFMIARIRTPAGMILIVTSEFSLWWNSCPSLSIWL